MADSGRLRRQRGSGVVVPLRSHSGPELLCASKLCFARFAVAATNIAPSGKESRKRLLGLAADRGQLVGGLGVPPSVISRAAAPIATGPRVDTTASRSGWSVNASASANTADQ